MTSAIICRPGCQGQAENARLRAENERLARENAQLRRDRDHAQLRARELQDQLRQERAILALPSKTLSASDKLTLIAVRDKAFNGRPNRPDVAGAEDGRGPFMRMHLPDLADSTGQSPDTVSSNLKHLEVVQMLERRIARTMCESSGHIKQHVEIAPLAAMRRLDLIADSEPRNHGGVRQRCKECGSEALVHRIVCSDCGAVASERMVNQPDVIEESGNSPTSTGPHLAGTVAALDVDGVPVAALEALPAGPPCIRCGVPKRQHPHGGYILMCDCAHAAHDPPLSQQPMRGPTLAQVLVPVRGVVAL